MLSISDFFNKYPTSFIKHQMSTLKFLLMMMCIWGKRCHQKLSFHLQPFRLMSIKAKNFFPIECNEKQNEAFSMAWQWRKRKFMNQNFSTSFVYRRSQASKKNFQDLFLFHLALFFCVDTIITKGNLLLKWMMEICEEWKKVQNKLSELLKFRL